MEYINYNREMEKIISGFKTRPNILLHSCCGPCSTSVIERLSEAFDITVFFYNPNIDDFEEYQKRKKNQIKYISERYSGDERVKFVEGKYDVENFMKFAEPMGEIEEGGARCTKCFEMRLREAASFAEKNNFMYFATTLSVSPMKNPYVINNIGLSLEKEFRVKYLVSDFKKKAGYQRSIELSKEYGLYRQHYCGCRFSKWDIEKD